MAIGQKEMKKSNRKDLYFLTIYLTDNTGDKAGGHGARTQDEWNLYPKGKNITFDYLHMW